MNYNLKLLSASTFHNMPLNQPMLCVVEPYSFHLNNPEPWLLPKWNVWPFTVKKLAIY
jgi:hypothetical protein